MARNSRGSAARRFDAALTLLMRDPRWKGDVRVELRALDGDLAGVRITDRTERVPVLCTRRAVPHAGQKFFASGR